jgi:hypothetical protein
MIYLMTLIETMNIDNNQINFYDGVDFDILINHPKDGSKGFLICFLESWINEVKIYNRNNKIKSVFNKEEYSDFEWERINNNFISIYQADGIGVFEIYKVIRNKFINKQLPESPWIPVSGIDGAWKIEIGKSYD